MKPAPVILEPTYHTEERLTPHVEGRPEESRQECLRVEIRIVWDETLDVVVVARCPAAGLDSERKQEAFCDLRNAAKKLAETLAKADTEG